MCHARLVMVSATHAPAAAALQGRHALAAPSRTAMQLPVGLHGLVSTRMPLFLATSMCAHMPHPAPRRGRRAQVMAIAQVIARDYGGQRDLSGLGGVETGRDAAEFLLLGSNSVQVRAGPRPQGVS